MNINATLFAQAAVFAIFIWISVKFIWPHMLNIIETRQKTIADGLAAAEQGKATTSLVRGADEVRRIAKQTARAMAEQADAVSSCATNAARQSASLESVARATAEQSTSSAKVAQSVVDARGRVKEIAAGAAQQAKGAQLITSDAGEVAAQAVKLRRSSEGHADAMAAVVSAIAELETGERPAPAAGQE